MGISTSLQCQNRAPCTRENNTSVFSNKQLQRSSLILQKPRILHLEVYMHSQLQGDIFVRRVLVNI